MAQVLMYSKDPCPYCVAAKRFFQERGIAYQEIDLTGKIDEMLKIKAQTGWSTFPIILINNKIIGGYTDMKDLDDEGKLDDLLSQASP